MQIEQERRQEGEGTTRSACVSVPHYFLADFLHKCFAGLSLLCSVRYMTQYKPSQCREGDLKTVNYKYVNSGASHLNLHKLLGRQKTSEFAWPLVFVFLYLQWHFRSSWKQVRKYRLLSVRSARGTWPDRTVPNSWVGLMAISTCGQRPQELHFLCYENALSKLLYTPNSVFNTLKTRRAVPQYCSTTSWR